MAKKKVVGVIFRTIGNALLEHEDGDTTTITNNNNNNITITKDFFDTSRQNESPRDQQTSVNSELLRSYYENKRGQV